MTVDLEKHAEAILRLAGIPDNLPYSPTAWDEARTAILSACRTLAENAALAMREAAVTAIYNATPHMIDPTDEEAEYVAGLDHAKYAIRAIDPASAIEVTP